MRGAKIHAWAKSKQWQSLRMSYRHRLRWLLSALLVIVFQEATGDSPDATELDFELHVRQQAQQFSDETGVGLPHLVFDTGDMGVRVDGKVYIGRNAVDRTLEGLDPRARSLGLRFLVGHEFWHHWQLQRGNVDFTQLRPQRRKLLECQADMMGVVWALRGTRGLRVKDIESVVAVIARLTSKDTGHHLPAQLRLIILSHATGLALANAKWRGLEEASLSILANNLEQFVGPRTEPSDWTLDRCKMLMQYSPDGATGALSVNKFSAKPVETGNGPRPHRIDVEYSNDGDRAVRLKGLLGDVSVSEWLNTSRRVRYQHYEVTVPGHGKARINGVATLPTDRPENLDRFVETGESLNTSEALLYANFIEQEGCHLAPSRPDEAIASRIVAELRRLAEDGRNGFVETISRSVPELNWDGQLEFYKVLDAVPGLDDSTLLPEQREPAWVYLKLHSGSSKAEAEIELKRYQDLFISWCRAAGVAVRINDEGRLSIPKFSRTMSVSLERTSRERTRGGVERTEHSVTLRVRQQDPPDEQLMPRCVASIGSGSTPWEERVSAMMVRLDTDAETGFVASGRRTRSWVIGNLLVNDLKGLPPEVLSASLYPARMEPARMTADHEAASEVAANRLFAQIQAALNRRCAAGSGRVVRSSGDEGWPRIDVADFARGVSLTVQRGEGRMIFFELDPYAASTGQ